MRIQTPETRQDNPMPRKKQCALAIALALAAGGAGAGVTLQAAQAAVPPPAAGDVNPEATRKPGVRVAELCTIDPVPGSHGYRKPGGGFRFRR